MSNIYVCFEDTWYKLVRRRCEGEDYDTAVCVFNPLDAQPPDGREQFIYHSIEQMQQDGVYYGRVEYAEEDVPAEIWAKIAQKALEQ